jgi:hypothetical protein
MTPQQTALAQQILSIVGMVFTTLGWTTPSEVATWSTTILQFLGPAMTLGGLIYAAITTRKSALVSQVASMPEVRAVITTPTAAGHDLANSTATPSNVVVGQAPGSIVPPAPPHP